MPNENQTNLQEIIQTKNKKKDHKPHKKIRLNYKTLGSILIILILLVNTYQIMKFSSIVEKVDKYNQGVVDELGKFRKNIIEFGEDLNETRAFLLLPTKSYSLTNTQEKITTKDDNPKEAQAIYTYLTQITEQKQQTQDEEKIKERIKNIQKDETFNKEIKNLNLKIAITEDPKSFKLQEEKTAIFTVVGNIKTQQIKIQSALGEKTISKEESTDIQNLIKYIKTNKEKAKQNKKLIEEAKATIKTVLTGETVQNQLKIKTLILENTPLETETTYTYEIKNKEGKTLSTIEINRETGKIKIGEKEIANNSLRTELLNLIKTLSGTTATEKLVKQKQEELEKIFNEAAFTETLAQNGLTLENKPKEENGKIIYNVKNKDGKVEFSFAIEQSSGRYKIIKDDTETDLLNILDQTVKKKP